MNYSIELIEVPEPKRDCPGAPVPLSDQTIGSRVTKVLRAMRASGFEQLVVYGDVEHGSNFEYLVGFFPRFEEALFVIDASGKMTLMLGNENLNKAGKARIKARAIHVPQFSLPNQPDAVGCSLSELMVEAGVREGGRVGLVGWKMLRGSDGVKGEDLFDVPCYIVEALRATVGKSGSIKNATSLFIGKDGVRTTNTPNEIEHYEFSSSLASDCILDALDALDAGVSEMDLGGLLVRGGQRTSVVTIASTGERFLKGNMFPTNRRVREGDPVSLTVGYRGGLSSRSGFAVWDTNGLPEEQDGWLQRVAVPYFAAYARWLETIQVGMTGGELFDVIDSILPREHYGWALCPGHLTAEEEWMSSPVYEGSREPLTSGMLFQIDIIPAVEGYSGVSAESTVVLADKKLRDQIAHDCPEMWKRMCSRREYLTHTLGLAVSEDVLPMCSTVAYLRPYMLDHGKALVRTAY